MWRRLHYSSHYVLHHAHCQILHIVVGSAEADDDVGRLKCLMGELELLVGHCMSELPAERGDFEFVGDSEHAGGCFTLRGVAIDGEQFQGKSIDGVIVDDGSHEVSLRLVFLDLIIIDDEVLLAVLEEVVGCKRPDVGQVECRNPKWIVITHVRHIGIESVCWVVRPTCLVDALLIVVNIWVARQRLFS